MHAAVRPAQELGRAAVPALVGRISKLRRNLARRSANGEFAIGGSVRRAGRE
jgi:hypothetical protein